MADEQQRTFTVSDRRSSHVAVDPETNRLNTSNLSPEPHQQRRVTGYFPIADRIIVRRFSEQEVSAGGIIIPDVGKEKPAQGQVLAVGPGRYDPMSGSFIPISVKQGDYILFGKYAGTDVNINGEDLLIMRDEEIFIRLEFEELPPAVDSGDPSVPAPLSTL